MYDDTHYRKRERDLYSAYSRNNLASQELRYDTCYTMVHTVLPATKHEPHLSFSTPQLLSITTLWSVLIAPTHGGMTRLS